MSAPQTDPAHLVEGWAQYSVLVVIDPERTFPIRRGYDPAELQNWVDARGMVCWIGGQAQFAIEVVHGTCPSDVPTTPFRCVSGKIHVGSVEYILSPASYDEFGEVFEGAELPLPHGDYVVAVEDFGEQRFRLTFEPTIAGPPSVWERAAAFGFTVFREGGDVIGFVFPYGLRVDLRHATEPPEWLAPEWPVRKRYGDIVLLEQDDTSLALSVSEEHQTLLIAGSHIEDVVADIMDQETELVDAEEELAGWGWEHPCLPAELLTEDLPAELWGTTLHITHERSWFPAQPGASPPDDGDDGPAEPDDAADDEEGGADPLGDWATPDEEPTHPKPYYPWWFLMVVAVNLVIMLYAVYTFGWQGSS